MGKASARPARTPTLLRRTTRHLAQGAVILGIAVAAGALVGVKSPFAASEAKSAVGDPTLFPLDPATAPLPTGAIGKYVIDQAAAVRLGKALFWDIQAGSDNQTACASCHFSAGTDNRSLNTTSPGKDANGVQQTNSGFLANQQLTAGNFPLLDGTVVGSQGIVPSLFNSIGSLGAENTSPAEGDFVFTDGTPGVNEVQTLTGPASGTFELEFNGAVTTASLQPTASAANVEAALADLVNIGVGGVHAAGGPLDTTPITVTFDGNAVAGRNVPLLKAVPGSGIGIAETAQGGAGSAHNLRRVTGRNSPSVINAVFNDRNFWDGRAQNHFNGVNPFGTRDTTAAALKAVSIAGADGATPGNPTKIPDAELNDASLASQAVGPPGNNVEMSSDGRTLRDIGKKLLNRQPLGSQIVAPSDSVLGGLAVPGGTGLNTTYRDMVMAAFNPQWWRGRGGTISAAGTVTSGAPNSIAPDAVLPSGSYSQMQYNWPLFWGLAINMYEATLVSDQTPFDSFMRGVTTAMTDSQKAGMAVFTRPDTACDGCHVGPAMTGASTSEVLGAPSEFIARINECEDVGFSNIGVRPTASDQGITGTDPFGNSLSATKFAPPNPACGPVPSALLRVNGAFKTPGLRNVGLTAPYFHTGNRSTLEQVIDFYAQGGDAPGPDQSPEIAGFVLTATEKAQLVDFLRNALTDQRVQRQAAPFDHPQLPVPNGGNLAATGAAGTATPFGTFLGLAAPVPNPPFVPQPPPPPPPPPFKFGIKFTQKLRVPNVKKKGFTLTVTLPAGTAKVRIHLLKITKKGQVLTASFDKIVVGKTGPVKILVPTKRLKRLTPGRYIVTVTQVGPANKSLETIKRRLNLTK